MSKFEMFAERQRIAVRVGFLSSLAACLLIGKLSQSASAQSPPTIQQINLYSGLTVTGAVNSVVSIQAADAVAADSWQTLTNLVLPASPYVWVDPSHPADGARFYRLAVPSNVWTGLDISAAAKQKLLSTSSSPAAFAFTFNGGGFATSSWLRKFAFAEPGIPDDGLVPIPAVTDPGWFKVYVPSAIMISGPLGRQPSPVSVSLIPDQQRQYSKLAVLQGACWGDGVYKATVHYDSGSDVAYNLNAYDWSKATTSAPAAMRLAATSRDTHPQFGNTCYLYSQAVGLDASRKVLSITFTVSSIIPPSGVSTADAAARFAVGIMGVSALQ